MNIFVIPSWYPTIVNPINGIFIREQAMALAEVNPDFQVVVSCWGHESGTVSFRSIKKFFASLKWYFLQPRLSVNEKGRFCEILRPALTFSRRLPFCTLKRLVDVNRANFEWAQKTFRNIDVIHAHVSYPAGYIAYKLSKEFGVPYVLTEHMGPFPGSFSREGNPLDELEKAFRFSSKVIAVSNSLARRLRFFGYSNIAVIPNSVDENRFFLGVPTSQKFIFSTLCGLDEVKGIDTLLHAIALWGPSSDEVEFRIGGDGPLLSKLQCLAKDLNISSLIKWTGSVKRDLVPDFFRQSHVFVMASRHETFGVVYAEAIASGKPIIATRCGGPEDIVSVINGILVNVDNIEELSMALTKVYKKWDLYDPKKIRQEFIRKFSTTAVIEQLKNVYIEVGQKITK